MKLPQGFAKPCRALTSPKTIHLDGDKLQIRVLGLASTGAALTPDLDLAIIKSISVLCALHAHLAVKAALMSRTH